MEQKQLMSLIADIAPVLKDFVQQSFSPLAARIDAIDKRFSQLPVPSNGKDADPEHVASLVFLRLEPEIAEIKGVAAEVIKTADQHMGAMVIDLSAKIKFAADEYLKANPPAPGKDGESVTIEQVTPVLDEVARKILTLDRVKSAVLELPEAIGAAAADYLKANPPASGKDGASVSVEDVTPFLATETKKLITGDLVKSALLAFPEAIDAAAANYLKENPPPAGEPGKNGASVTVEELAPFIAAETAKLITPERVKSAVLEFPGSIHAAAAHYLKDNPPASGKDGKDATPLTPEDIAPLVAIETAKALTPERIKLAVLELPTAIAGAVADYLRAHPPVPGKDGSSVILSDLEPYLAPELARLLTTEKVKAAVLGVPEAIAGAVAEFLKVNPPPAGKDGSSVVLSDLEPFVAPELAKALTPDRIKSAVLELPEVISGAVSEYLKLNPPAPGKDGSSIVASDLQPFVEAEAAKTLTLDRIKSAVLELPEVIAGAVSEYLKLNPPAPGKDGSSIVASDLQPFVEAETAKNLTPDRIKSAVLELPEVIAGAVSEYLKLNPPAPGKDGSSVSLDDLSPLIAAEAEKMITPDRVKSVVELSDVVSVAVAKYVRENPPSAGKDGVGISGALINRAGELIITDSAGKLHNLGCVVGKDAPPATVELTAESSQELDDDVAKQVAAAVRLLAELPDVSKMDAPAPASETHIHIPDIIVPEIKYPAIMVPEIKIPESIVNVHVEKQDPAVINITTPQTPAPTVNIEREKKPKKTRTKVLKHDAKGRVLEFEQEEV